MAASLYETIGVKRDATADEIRKAYRKLARKHHPDVNPGDKKSEEAFKKASSAYEVLSDDKRRKAYDEFGDESLQGGFDATKAREYAKWQNTRQQQRASNFGDGPVEFDFADLFGRAAPRGPSKGQDLVAAVQLDLRQAIEGTEMATSIPGHGNVRVRIPPGADTGDRIRVPGKGSPGRGGGPPGDLIIETEVRPHPHLRRVGLDLHLALPVTLDEAYNGANVEVPTFEGPVVVKIPPRSQNHSKLRVKGKGIPRKDTRGNLIVELDVRMPDLDDPALAEALKAARTAYTNPVRQELML